MVKSFSMKPEGNISGGAGNVVDRKNAVADYSGTGASRAFSVMPASGTTTQVGAYNDSETKLEGPTGQPVGTDDSRYANVNADEFTQKIGHAQPLKESGRAVDVVGGPSSGQTYAIAKPNRRGRKL